MNNPFLSDRNIFSKVNSLKKKSEVDNKDPIGVDNPKNTQNVNKQPFNPNSYLQKFQQPNENPPSYSNPTTVSQPPSKMSFGKPTQLDSRMSFNKKYDPNPISEMNKPSPAESGIEIGNKYSTFKIGENSSTFTKNDYKSISLEQSDKFTNPAEDIKFQQYRKANNYRQYSPINPQPSKKMQDSQFLNIDAIGDGLNRFLAQSKNQEQICKLLGISKDPKHEQRMEAKTVLRQPERHIIYDPKQAEILQSQKISAFSKQKIRATRGNQPFQPLKSIPKVLQAKEQRQYIPTFNYAGLQHEHEAISREQEHIPRFNQIREPQRNFVNETSKDNLEVFNYSQANVSQSQRSVQQIIAEQMNSLCTNGKYRTFLTSTQKIVTVRYKLQPL